MKYPNSTSMSVSAGNLKFNMFKAFTSQAHTHISLEILTNQYPEQLSQGNESCNETKKGSCGESDGFYVTSNNLIRREDQWASHHPAVCKIARTNQLFAQRGPGPGRYYVVSGERQWSYLGGCNCKKHGSLFFQEILHPSIFNFCTLKHMEA